MALAFRPIVWLIDPDGDWLGWMVVALAEIAVAVCVMVPVAAWQEYQFKKTHECIESHRAWMAPHVVLVGKSAVMIPGYHYTQCDKWIKKVERHASDPNR